MLLLSGTRTRLTPSFYGSMARLPRFRSDLLRCSLPCPSPIISSFPPRVHLHLPSAHGASPRLVRLFVPSFVRVTLAESTPARRFGDFNARQLLFSYLSISLSFTPLSFPPPLFPFTLPFPPPPRRDTRALLSFPRLVPSSFPIRRVSTVNRYFRSDAFRLSIRSSPSLSFVNSTCSSQSFLPSSFSQVIQCKMCKSVDWRCKMCLFLII